MSPAPRRPSLPPQPPAQSPPLPPLRLTRRGLVRLVQLGATAGALGVAAVSCGIRLDSGGSAVAADRTVPFDAGGTGAVAGGSRASGATTAHGVAPEASAPGRAVPPAGSPAAAPAAAALPGVGPSWTARLAGHDQVVLVTAAGSAATRNVVRWFDRTVGADGTPQWALRSTVAGWNGAGGWTTDHTVGDGRSPVGVYSLTDAGGFDPNPGTALPYQYSTAEYSEIVNGVRTFAHVLAIDYNRVVGTPPSNSVRPGGWSRGGSIWVHVEHDSPTQACVGIPDASLVALLRWLRPAARPVILMGPSGILAS
jgi:L,D-peptidoglycan transpeptidase YkuD (ErfK/YbiS/YcfS/YnhG family)